MRIIRRIDSKDLEMFFQFACKANFGITSMPRDKNILQKKIDRSNQSFQSNVLEPNKESYLFVLEDLESSRIGGVCGICAKSGVLEPKYYYQKETIRRKQTGLPIPETQEIIRPITLKNGATEIGTLFLDHSFRKEGLGRLLSLSRFLFIASFPERFGQSILADMRGFVDENNTAVFWEKFGRLFLDLSFNEVMQLLEKGNEFIPDILPEFPIYLSLLPKEALFAMGKVHFNTQAALHMLLDEGFTPSNKFDIFDGGPVIQANQSQIKTIRESRFVKIEELTNEDPSSRLFILSNNKLDFRACYGNLSLNKEKKGTISKKVAAALQLNKGDVLCCIPFSMRS